MKILQQEPIQTSLSIDERDTIIRSEERLETAQQCYLECLAVECGEGECARAIRTKFNLKGYHAK